MIPGSWRFLEVVSTTGFLFSRSFWKQSYGWTDLMPLGQTAKHSFSPAVSLTKPSDRLLLLLSLNSGIFKMPFLLFCWVFICLFPLPPRCIWWYSGDLSFLLLIEILLILCSLSSPGKCVLVLILSEQHQTSLVYVELDWVSTMVAWQRSLTDMKRGILKCVKSSGVGETLWTSQIRRIHGKCSKTWKSP